LLQNPLRLASTVVVAKVVEQKLKLPTLALSIWNFYSDSTI